MPINILVAEDDPVSRNLLCRILETDADNRAIPAADGAEAWALLNEPARAVDLAFLDIMMPQINGLDLAERIRTTPALHSLPIILCTALQDRQTVSKAAALGLRHYIVKPVNKPIVIAKLKAALAGSPARPVSPSPTPAVRPLAPVVPMVGYRAV
jgi:CheY-like chemotaxis protein